MNVLVVHAHPTPNSFNEAVFARAVATLRSNHHQVDVLDLYEEDFDARLTRAEWESHRIGIAARPDLVDHAERLGRAEALVFVYPTWWGGLPAILKGWIDRVWTEGVAYTLPEGAGRPRGRLRNVRRVVILTTHGSSKLKNLAQGEPGKHLLRRGLRVLLHPLVRIKWVALYGLDRANEDDRAGFLDRVERAMNSL